MLFPFFCAVFICLKSSVAFFVFLGKQHRQTLEAGLRVSGLKKKTFFQPPTAYLFAPAKNRGAVFNPVLCSTFWSCCFLRLFGWGSLRPSLADFVDRFGLSALAKDMQSGVRPTPLRLGGISPLHPPFRQPLPALRQVYSKTPAF